MENGGNNPPVPELIGEVATGSTFSSTDATALDVPAIAGRPAATIEGPRHANVSASDDIMNYLKKQHIALQRFTWSTSQLPGTLLVNIPITPLRANNIISYLAGIFNAWNGGLEYQAKVAGTGFHAGALGIARIPPNIDPVTLKTVQQFTAFEYSVIDPKTLEAISKHIPDQRPIMYHYMNNDFTDPNNIGGHFVIFVILQLNTSSTGTNQIDVEIFNKLAPDFRFIQVIPPNLPSQPSTDIDKWNSLFSTPANHLHTIFPFQISTLTINPNSFSSAAKVGLRNLSGQLSLDDTYSEDVVGNFANFGFPFYATSATSLVPVLNSTIQFNKQISVNMTTPFFKTYSSTAANAVLAGTAPILFNAPNTVVGALVGAYYNLLPNLSAPITATYPGVPVVSAPAGESLITFSMGGSNATPPMLTTRYLSFAFKTGQFSIATNEAVLGQIFSNTSGLPVAFIKIYHSGIITSNLQLTALNLDFSDLNIQFVSFIQASQPIPNLTQIMLQSLQSIRLERLLQRTRQLHLGD
jgi:hypothetical protein